MLKKLFLKYLGLFNLKNNHQEFFNSEISSNFQCVERYLEKAYENLKDDNEGK